MGKNIIAIDQGTTGTTVLILNEKLEVVGRAYKEILPSYPRPGWVELDPSSLWDGTLEALAKALKESNLGQGSIAGIGITNQRETICAWNPKTMVPYGNAIVWQCRRTADYCDKLCKDGHEELVRKTTGLLLDPYFSASKIRWMLENIAGLSERVKAGAVVFGTVDTFLVHRLSLGASLVTDVSNASRTSLMNLNTLDWDDSMLNLFQVPRNCLPQIVSSSESVARTKGLQFLRDGVPISGILGDQQAALFGQLCWEPGDSKITYGTGCFLLTNTGPTPVMSKHGLLTTVAWRNQGEVNYALEGSAFMGGATVQWLRDGLGLISKSADIEDLARQARPEDMGDLTLVPAMTGLGAPHWDASARGIISGITRGTNRAHIARAALEGIAHQNDDLLSAIAKDLGAPLTSLRVDGGAASNNLLMQLQCDLAGVELLRPKMQETTALGAALAAGLGAGVWANKSEARASWQLDQKFTPYMTHDEIKSRRTRWKKAIQRCRLSTE